MAGTTQGATTPDLSPSPLDAPRVVRVHGDTRTRKNHGVMLLGDRLACVYSTRRHSQSLGVILTLALGATQVEGFMSPRQARTLARALESAAASAELLPGSGDDRDEYPAQGDEA